MPSDRWAKGQKVLCLKRKQLRKPTCCFCLFTGEGVKVSPEQSPVSNKTNAYEYKFCSHQNIRKVWLLVFLALFYPGIIKWLDSP